MGIDKDLADALLSRYSGGLTTLSGTLLPGTYVGQGTYHDAEAVIIAHTGSRDDFDRPTIEANLSSSLESMKEDLWVCFGLVLDELDLS